MKFRQANKLRHMQDMYDYIAANPNCTMHMLCCWFASCASTLRTPLHYLRDGGFVESTPGKRSKGGQEPSLYNIIPGKGRPTVAPARKQRDNTVSDTGVKRIFKPARQLDLERDPFIAAFFGPAKASQVSA